MKDLTWLDWVCWILVIIGGLNWLIIGLFNVNLIATIFGGILSRIIFILVGLATIYLIWLKFKTKQPAP